MAWQVRVGIDPGACGAIAIMHSDANGDNWRVKFYDMPTRKMNNGKTEVNARELHRILGMNSIYKCIIESVHAMPGQGVTSMFSFGGAFYSAIAVLDILAIPYDRVEPRRWKATYALIGTDKDAARLKAIELFPQAADQLKRKKDGGRADALLMAAWELQ